MNEMAEYKKTTGYCYRLMAKRLGCSLNQCFVTTKGIKPITLNMLEKIEIAKKKDITRGLLVRNTWSCDSHGY